MTTAINVQNAITIEQGKPMTCSRAVAEHFLKRHADVLRSIASLECSAGFSERNFSSAKYLDDQNKPRVVNDMSRASTAARCRALS